MEIIKYFYLNIFKWLIVYIYFEKIQIQHMTKMQAIW